MKKLFIYPLLFSSIHFANAQIVDIPDLQMKRALVENDAINTNKNNEIEVFEAESFTGTLSLGSRFSTAAETIEDLKGLEAFTNIEELFLVNVAAPIIDLSGNTALRRFNVFNRNFSTTPINFPNVTFDFSLNTLLTEVTIITPDFEVLDLSNAVNIDRLRITGGSYETLNLSSNLALNNLSIAANPSLININLPESANLESIRISDSEISSIDVSKNPNLVLLEIDQGALEEIEVSQNTELSRLGITGNNIKDIDISNNINLTGLDLSNNQLQSLDVSNNPNLRQILAANNQLSSFNMANGNNADIAPTNEAFSSINNPNLICVEVDSGFIAPSGWSFDSQTNFNSDCSGSVLSVNEFFNSTANDIVLWSNDRIQISDHVEVSSLSVYGLTGNRLASVSQNFIDTSFLQAGMYILTIERSLGDYAYLKFIKQ